MWLHDHVSRLQSQFVNCLAVIAVASTLQGCGGNVDTAEVSAFTSCGIVAALIVLAFAVRSERLPRPVYALQTS